MKLWQLKRISTNEVLNEPQVLPENWGPIFGMQGVVEKIGDLSWTGDPELQDKGWFVVGDAPEVVKLETTTKSELEWDRAKQLLKESDWSMLSDVAMTKEEKIKWMEYRKSLREIKLQPGFPNEIIWPVRP
jgi:hypothetical protein